MKKSKLSKITVRVDAEDFRIKIERFEAVENPGSFTTPPEVYSKSEKVYKSQLNVVKYFSMHPTGAVMYTTPDYEADAVSALTEAIGKALRKERDLANMELSRLTNQAKTTIKII